MSKSKDLGGFMDVFAKNSEPGMVTAASVVALGADMAKYVALAIMFGKAVTLYKQRDISTIPSCVGWIQATNFVTLDPAMSEIGTMAMAGNLAATSRGAMIKTFAASVAAFVFNTAAIGYAQMQDLKEVQKKCAQGEKIERYGAVCPKVNFGPEQPVSPGSP
ncbi:MAG: hypothetical protein RBR86_07670 [Pseudobdellovibrionaceae bacterium]|jgi:hypothetical protein|nr:hypothetical protein [Pseudobdellovibrionaceae bacterium]